jgi:hypothetical protein
MTALTAIFLFVSTGKAVILHPEGQPGPDWTDKPHPNTVGKWGTNASCVVVAPNYVITTRHQGGSESTAVTIAGSTYSIEQIWIHPDFSNADLRLVKLRNANLSHYALPYSLETDIDETKQSIVIGGFGMGEGPALQTDETTYGYLWDGTPNTTLRWGTNTIDSTLNNSTIGSLTSDILIADFDELDKNVTDDFQCAPAAYDSGGGWFIKVDDTWKVAGISRAVEHVDETWFRNSENPRIPDPDLFDAVRISSYADWIIEMTIPICTSPPVGDFNTDCAIDIGDFVRLVEQWLRQDCQPANNSCDGVDIAPDGSVNLDDFARFAESWAQNQ